MMTQKELVKYTNAFELIWKDAPFRRLRKRKAFEIFLREVKTKEDYMVLHKAIDNYRIEIQNKPRQYILHATTFLNNFRDWADEIPADPLEQLLSPEDKDSLEKEINKLKSMGMEHLIPALKKSYGV